MPLLGEVMAIVPDVYIYIGLSTDTKPTGAQYGALCLETDTGDWYVTHDGTTWAVDKRSWRYG